MCARRSLLVLATFAATVTASLAQERTPASQPAIAAVAAPRAAAPDLSGIWRHPSFPGFEPPLSGAGPVLNKARRNGHNDLYLSVGDDANPILQPWAAAVVKEHGERAVAEGGFPTPSTQCSPAGVPYIFASFGTQLLQEPQQVTILYSHPFIEYRQIRLNVPHSSPVTPSWYGDSVGHYEGDTLVIDTVGLKMGPFSMIDMFGTPFTRALHVIERYRLIDYEVAKASIALDAKWNNQFTQNINRDDPGKHLQLEFTVEDPGAFTMPWKATITYGPSEPDFSKTLSPEWDEHICAENPPQYYGPPPTADRPDF